MLNACLFSPFSTVFVSAGGQDFGLLQQCTGKVPFIDIVMLVVWMKGFDEDVGSAKRIFKFCKVNSCLLT